MTSIMRSTSSFRATRRSGLAIVAAAPALFARTVPVVVAAPAAARAAQASLALELSPTSVRQGRTLVVTLDVDEAYGGDAPLSAWVTLGPSGAEAVAPLRTFAVGATRFLALAGIPIDAPLGAWEVTAGVIDATGAEVAFGTAPLEIVDGAFSVQRIAFPAEQTSLLDPEVGALEWLTMATVFASSASEPGDEAPRWTGTFKQPVGGRVVTRHGARRDYLAPTGQVVQQSQHGGIDLAVPMGTPIPAPADGVVAFTGRWSIRGNVVVVSHGVGVHTVHAHALDFAVNPGDPVAAGQILARVGSTGLSTGPHLHWEVRVNGVAVDPFEWIERPFV